MIYPRRCPACDRPAGMGHLICPECQGKFRLIEDAFCLKCGRRINEEGEYCEDCQKKKHRFQQGRALFEYNSVNQSIYRFKYKGRAEYADYFGEQLALHLEKEIRNWGIQGITAVPLHKTKLQKRGYNQAGLLAKRLAEQLELPYLENLIIRKRKTAPLKELSSNERQINLKNSFIVRDNDVKLKRVLVVDDIYTTGSTIDAISNELHKNGVDKVYFVTLSAGTGV